MGEAELAQLAELVKTDPAFRAKFQADPKGAASSSGIPLTDQELDSLTRDFGDSLGVEAREGP